AARRNRLELLMEVIPSKVGPVDDATTARVIQRIYDAGIFPDWWKLEPLTTAAAWAQASIAITRNDPNTRGIVVLGLEAPVPDLARAFALAACEPLVKGFAVGRTIFANAAKAWMAGKMTDAQARAEMARNFQTLCDVWGTAKAAAKTGAKGGDAQ
ncbi:MAG: DUF2090 domain-containing protein, partial [Paracoccaceae bacterium]|nr:DUF2090 domain-containing protein [Paracoccaceae bacterium]